MGGICLQKGRALKNSLLLEQRLVITQLVGLDLLVASKQSAQLLAFEPLPEVIYLSGGWGGAALTFGLLRFFAGKEQNSQLQWFVAAFGIFEGGFLTCYGLFLTASTALTFFKLSLSTIFAAVFFIAYLIAFMLRTKQNLNRTEK